MTRARLLALLTVVACGGADPTATGTTTTADPPDPTTGSEPDPTTTTTADPTTTQPDPDTTSATGTTGTTTPDDTTGEPPPTGAFDLDEDGAPETDLSLGTCTNGGGTCLHVSSPLTSVTEVALADTPDQCDGTLVGPHLTQIGDHGGDGLAEVAARFCRFDGLQGPPALAVVDLNLIYHRRQYTLSPATLTLLNTVEYDVAAATEPNAPKWFHSGRNYGTHAAVVGADTKDRLVIVGGTPVGTFTDDLCNVSRYLAVLESTAGQANTRALAWSKYFGFSSTIFSTYDAQYAADPMQDVARLADAVDGCIHRFADSRTTMDGAEVLLINYFAMDAPIDLCLHEQFALYQPPTWTPEKADAWYGCFAKNRTSPGVWGMQVLDERTGTGLTGSQGTYVWGWSDELLPGERVYLVEYMAGPGAWDLSDRAPSALQVNALAGGVWQARGVFPVAGRPKIRVAAPQGPLGAGSSTYIAELTLHPGAPPGVELEDGTIIGHSVDGWIVR